MSRLKFVLFFAFVLILAMPALMSAKTYYVGTCKSNDFSTIQTAVNSVPSGSTVMVCPGTYNEQVTITQPLTLKAVATATSDLVLIQGASRLIFSPAQGMDVSVQVLVSGTGPVNLSGITVDGTSVCPVDNSLESIFYQDASGTIDHVAVRNAVPGGGASCGGAVFVENDTASPISVNIQNSSFYNTRFGTYILGNTGSAALAVNVEDNFFNEPSRLGGAAIYYAQAIGTVSGNIVSGFLYGVVTDNGAATTISNNVITESDTGIQLRSPGNKVSNNQVFNVQYGISLARGSTNNTVQQNKVITNNIGGGGYNDTAISFDCSVMGNIVSGNTVSDKSIGIAFLPNGNTVQNNTFFNVSIPIPTTTCP